MSDYWKIIHCNLTLPVKANILATQAIKWELLREGWGDRGGEERGSGGERGGERSRESELQQQRKLNLKDK